MVDDGNLLNFDCVFQGNGHKIARTNSQNGIKIVYDTEIVHSFYQIDAHFQSFRISVKFSNF